MTRSTQPIGSWITGIVAVATAVVLIFVIPYSASLGNEKASLFLRAREFYGLADWTHCMIAPFVVGFLVYFTRKEWMGLPLRGHWIGLPILVLGFLLYWFGYRANVRYIGFAAIQVLVTGGVLWFMGWRWFRALLLPILFLCFAWPLAPLSDSRKSVALRTFNSELSTDFLNLVGVKTVQKGTSIMSAADPEKGIAVGEKFQMGVDNPCSGLRSLFAILMVGTIMAFVMLKSTWKRLLLIGLGVPIAVFGNFIRLLFLVFGTMFWGSDFAIEHEDGGTTHFHFLAGVLVFLVGAGLLYLVARVLKHGRKAFARKKIRRTRHVQTAQ